MSHEHQVAPGVHWTQDGEPLVLDDRHGDQSGALDGVPIATRAL